MTRENEAKIGGGQRLLRAAWWMHAIVGIILNWIILAPIVREVWLVRP